MRGRGDPLEARPCGEGGEDIAGGRVADAASLEGTFAQSADDGFIGVEGLNASSLEPVTVTHLAS